MALGLGVLFFVRVFRIICMWESSGHQSKIWRWQATLEAAITCVRRRYSAYDGT